MAGLQVSGISWEVDDGAEVGLAGPPAPGHHIALELRLVVQDLLRVEREGVHVSLRSSSDEAAPSRGAHKKQIIIFVDYLMHKHSQLNAFAHMIRSRQIVYEVLFKTQTLHGLGVRIEIASCVQT
jgi:hypothetical protein